MKPKRQRKYTSREMILKDIDAAHRKIKRLRETAHDLNEQASLYASMGNEMKAKHTREEAEKVFAKIGRLENTRLKKLGATLSAFDTVPMMAEGLNVEQVVLQSV